MKKILFPLFSLALTILSSFVFGLYSHQTLFLIVFSVFVLTISIGFQKKRLPIAISFFAESVVFCILIALSKEESTHPVFQQSIVLAVLMSVFFILHICSSLFALYIVIKNQEFSN